MGVSVAVFKKPNTFCWFEIMPKICASSFVSPLHGIILAP